uniref:Putative autophagy-related protein 36 n=1 Tax=Davidia involucrata TaxID=16924 RepID=A0A5B7B7E7_DAVIN
MAIDSEASLLSPKRSPETLENPETSPNKRLKALNSPPSSSPKGNDKIDESTVDSESNSCGICLSEEGKAIRGWIDSCDHYFCFVCIMEWSKVESCCPMCKRRFTTIRRPPVDGVFLSERVINVPVRDQVYHYFGNATMGPPIPYSEVQCTVCHNAADENLLLLCDLCDSASHTYCVGLGATVPEGDWFCQDCTVSRAEHAKSEMDTDCDNQTNFRNFHKKPPAEASVSIFDIVRESSITEVADNTTERGSRTHLSVAPNATALGARTLRHCRNVHGRIQALRENWNGFRSGALSFSSSSVDSGGSSSNQRHNVGALLCDRSGQSQTTSCSNQQLTAQKGSSCDTSHNRNSHDIGKAWKMMGVAKSIERARGRTSIVGHLKSNSTPPFTKDRGSIKSEKHYQCHSPGVGNDRHGSLMFEKQKQSTVTMRRNLKLYEEFPTTHSQGNYELPSAMKLPTSVQVDVCHGSGGKLSQENLLGASSDVFNDHDGSACLISPVRSVPMASNVTYAKLDVSSSCKMESSEGKARTEKSCVKSKAARDDDAKSEIQSLVKLNLKLLSRDKKLGVDAFKEVARLATHSILAACGLEHPKPGVHSFPSSVCSHTNEVQRLRMSTLMPSSCRECFYAFVKDVVNIIMFEKTGSAEMSC